MIAKTRKPKSNAEWITLPLLLALSLSFLPSALKAQPIVSYSATLEVLGFSYTFGGPSRPFELGDRFTFEFSLDHAATDINWNTQQGSFAGSLVDFSISRLSTNSGYWDPSGGGFNGSEIETSDDFDSEDSFSIHGLSPANFPSAYSECGGLLEARVKFEDQSQTAVNDTGSGQTLESVLEGVFDAVNFPNQKTGILIFDTCSILMNVLDIGVLDTDNDGLSDGVETNTGTFFDANDTGTDPNKIDTDGDGLYDGYEVANGTDPTVAGNGKAVPVPAIAAAVLAIGLLGITLLTNRIKQKAT